MVKQDSFCTGLTDMSRENRKEQRREQVVMPSKHSTTELRVAHGSGMMGHLDVRNTCDPIGMNFF